MPPETKIPNNQDIDLALKEFEAKSTGQETGKVNEGPKTPETFDTSDIDQALKEFEIKSRTEQKRETPETSKDSDLPKMVRFVIKFSGGLIQDQKQAEYVLLGVVILIIIVILIIVLKYVI
ncbi:MAG TPA: hypothetical protein VK675_01405 [Candidatus Paceibacterota bacterium]|nr:hypothetical protein [Candidatus Paceibacterota bacterium]